MDGTKRYVNFMEARPCCVVVSFILLAVGCFPFMMKLGSTATDNFGASKGQRSYTETELIKSQFPNVFDDMETLYIQCSGPNCNTSPDGAFKGVFDGLNKGMSPYIEDGTLVSTTDYFTAPSFMRDGFYNTTSQSMIATMDFNVTKGETATNDAVTKALDLIATLSTDEVKLYMSGQTASRLLATDAAGKLIGMADGTGMIFIILLFGWQVRSYRLTIIPVLNTGLVLIITEALVYPLSKSGIIVLPSYVPNVCLFLSIALSVDYSFFHLSRFQEVRRNNPGIPVKDAVDQMVRTAGRVVLVSGVVLLFTWLALAAFPVFGTDTLGYCSAITIFVCISVNLTMNPAMIFLFPKFFGNAGQDPCRCCKRRGGASSEPLADAANVDVTKNWYGRAAKNIVKMPCMIIVPVLVYLMLLPGAVRLFTADLVVGGVNGNTAATNYAANHILEEFPNSQGSVPLTVLLEAPSGSSVKNPEFFDQMAVLAKDVSDATGLSLNAFNGPSIVGGKCQTWAEVEAALNGSPDYSYFWHRGVNTQNTSVLVSVSLPFDAFSNDAKALVKNGRAAVDKFAKGNYGSAAIFHPMVVEVDAEALVQRRFIPVVVITLFVVFSVIAIRYRAALVPVKLFFTIALPIVSVLGTGAFVFQDGILNWTGIPSLQSQGGLVWINPVACTFMLIGFALDYDIFLFSRIYADRKEGRFLDDKEAIIHAVAVTGPVITTAGCIMALAFSGMVVQSTNPFLCQMGFTMIFGILVDTFIVRTLLVPAFLSMAGSYNWWPGKMPSAEDGAKTEPLTVDGVVTLA